MSKAWAGWRGGAGRGLARQMADPAHWPGQHVLSVYKAHDKQRLLNWVNLRAVASVSLLSSASEPAAAPPTPPVAHGADAYAVGMATADPCEVAVAATVASPTTPGGGPSAETAGSPAPIEVPTSAATATAVPGAAVELELPREVPFIVRVQDAVYRFRARDRADAQRWVNVLRRNIEVAAIVSV